ncbi:nuclear transport factor 2 family protein [Pseudomonas sp. RIT-To-2]|uniref:nuclear transport factor 2 family protein n=1 Tax=Pseudomonas sp. RIT-To-2 TaxID=3462541 RepID=UPI0024132CC3
MSHDQIIEQLIRNLENERYDAILEGDFDKFAAMAHPDLVYTHSNGVVDTLDSYLTKCRDGYYVYHELEHPIDEIRIVGDVALVFGEMNGSITSGGVGKALKNKCLAVWVREFGHWKLSAYQPTPFK